MEQQQQKIKVANNGSKTKKVVATPTGHHHHLDVKEAIVEVDTVSRTGGRHHEARVSIEVEDVNKCTGEVRRTKADMFEMTDDDDDC